MKLEVKLPGGDVVTVEGETQLELFSERARALEVFGESHCGECGSDSIRPVVRNVLSKDKKPQTFTYCEYRCNKCGSILSLGQQEGGYLFPKRKLNEQTGQPDMEHGKFGKHRGWHKYVPQAKDAAEATPQANQGRR